MTKGKKVKKSPLIKYLFVSMLILTIVTVGLIKFIDILPNNYFGILVGVFAIINFVLSILLFNSKILIRIFGGLLTTCYMFIMIVAIIYELNTIDFLKKIGKNEYKTLNYHVMVLNDSKINKLSDINGKKITLVDEYSEDVIRILSKDVNFKYEKVVLYTDLSDKLIKKQAEIIIIEDSVFRILEDENPDFISNSKTIYNFTVDIKQKEVKKSVNITKKPFNVFISGIDTYGNINSVSRSDVNLIATINPENHTIILTSIPRDYYVKLYDKNEYDKLTHAGIYGIDTSIKTIEDFMNIKINYYVKVNFTSLVKVVDELGGIDVDSKFAFTSQDGFTYKKGINHLNGKEALSFSRERKALPRGDKSRGENHQAVLTAIINKSLTKSVLTKYSSLIKSLKPSLVTNFTNSEITDFIKMQLDKNIKWKITYLNLDGTDGYEYTYSYTKNKLYVMIPDQSSIDSASMTINENFKK
ncbi:MAG: LCP family protein [Bacilli bacterium]|nr:LCP family protein [Bacilli bacterium]